MPVAAFLCLLNAVFLIVGALAPKLNGYGTWTDFAIGVGILFGSLLLFFFRRIVQDGEGVHWSEPVPAMPSEEEAAELAPTPTPVALA